MVDSLTELSPDALLARYRELRPALEDAYIKAEDAWGVTDGLHAKPQAVQLRSRIALGEAYCRHHEHNSDAKRHLLRLKHQYTEATADAHYQERCRIWREAFERFEDLEQQYLDVVREMRRRGIEEPIGEK